MVLKTGHLLGVLKLTTVFIISKLPDPVNSFEPDSWDEL